MNIYFKWNFHFYSINVFFLLTMALPVMSMETYSCIIVNINLTPRICFYRVYAILPLFLLD